jgi:DNA-binding MarR family transcriptional regulator
MNEPEGTFDHSNLATSLLERLMMLATEVQVRVVTVLKELELSESMLGAIWWLGVSDSPMSRRELAVRLRFDPSNVTLIADRLEARGLVERAVDSRDRRYKAMRLTDAGKAIRQQVLDAITDAAMFRQLSLEEQVQLNDLLGRALDTQRDWKHDHAHMFLKESGLPGD